MKEFQPIRRPLMILAAASACLMLFNCSCTPPVSGTYVAKSGPGILEKLEFSGGNVTLTMMEQKFQVPYSVKGKQVLLSANGQQLVLDIKDNCLDGGQVYGMLCKS
jgi:hypothetical protein